MNKADGNVNETYLFDMWHEIAILSFTEVLSLIESST